MLSLVSVFLLIHGEQPQHTHRLSRGWCFKRVYNRRARRGGSAENVNFAQVDGGNTAESSPSPTRASIPGRLSERNTGKSSLSPLFPKPSLLCLWGFHKKSVFAAVLTVSSLCH